MLSLSYVHFGGHPSYVTGELHTGMQSSVVSDAVLGAGDSFGASHH